MYQHDGDADVVTAEDVMQEGCGAGPWMAYKGVSQYLKSQWISNRALVPSLDPAP